MALLLISTKHLKNNTNLSQTLSKNGGGGNTPKSFYKASIVLIKKSKTLQENYRWVCVINIGAKILDKILANWI